MERQGSSEAASPARLLVGSLHDDALLVCRSLALDSFPSPLVLRTRTRAAVKEKGAAVQVGGSNSRRSSSSSSGSSSILPHFLCLPQACGLRTELEVAACRQAAL